MGEDKIHAQRRKNNRYLGLVLVGFVVLIFLMTMAKLREGQPIEGFDHIVRPQLQPQEDTK